MSILIQHITALKKASKKALAVLIDPDHDDLAVQNIAQICQTNQVDFIFVGGSIITHGELSNTIKIIKDNFSGLVYIFPGNELMIDQQADGILLLSLISGRNPEYLIGKHVTAAPTLAKSDLDIVATAYLLINGGKETSVSYISNTKPIPADKPDIAVATALAGKMLGMHCIYMDAGSGAQNAISNTMVSKVSKNINLPIIIGGGIRNAEKALELYKNGADVLVIGNGVENDQSLIKEIATIKNNILKTVEL